MITLLYNVRNIKKNVDYEHNYSNQWLQYKW